MTTFWKSSTYFTWTSNFVFLFQVSQFNSHSSKMLVSWSGSCAGSTKGIMIQVTRIWTSVWHSKAGNLQQRFSQVLGGFLFFKARTDRVEHIHLDGWFLKNKKLRTWPLNQGSTKSKNLLIIAGSLPTLWKVLKTQNWRFFWYEVSSQNWTWRICDYENLQNFGTRGVLISKIW